MGATVFQLFHMFHVRVKLICQVKIAALVLGRVQRAGFTIRSNLLCRQSDRQTNKLSFLWYWFSTLNYMHCMKWSPGSVCTDFVSFFTHSYSISSIFQRIVPSLYRSNGAIHKMPVTRSTGLIEHLTSETMPTLSSPVIMEVNLDFSVSLQPTHKVFSPDDSSPAPHH